ncbi:MULTISPECIES: hypothetical protein [unclassified Streptomyces]|uniref:hypothetical protein n=1 Tax=unclassified Streptomyces TaxID=2593676 RepID=UPI000A539A44|nr:MULTISPECIES: hypothetical protein [unclassified Streptomyces]
MAKKTVLFNQTISVTVTVETDSTDPEEIVEQAWEEAPGGVCAHCSGWGQRWSRDDDGELEPVKINGKYEIYAEDE